MYQVLYATICYVQNKQYKCLNFFKVAELSENYENGNIEPKIRETSGYPLSTVKIAIDQFPIEETISHRLC